MNIFYECAGKISLRILARGKGIPQAQLEAEIQAAIDRAWNSDCAAVKYLQAELFPDGKPTPAMFVYVMSQLC